MRGCLYIKSEGVLNYTCACACAHVVVIYQ